VRKKRSAGSARDWTACLGQVRETGDRRASLPLLDRFLDPATDDDRRAEIAATLRTLEDLRCAEPLLRAVLDTDLGIDLRSLALEVYGGIPIDAATREQALLWARSPDVVIRAFGVRSLDVPDGETLAAAARDPAPLVRYAAVGAMASITRTKPLVEAARRALSDDDATIREAACRVALFDEPLDTTHELVRALSDDSMAVRVAACDALEDFPRISVLLALADARGDSESGLAAHLAFDGIVRRVRASMAEASPRARRRLGRWAEPVGWLLDGPESELMDIDAFDDALDAVEPRPEDVDVDEAESVLFDDDAPPSAQRRMLVSRSWAEAGEAGRSLLRRCADSPNWSLRQGAAIALTEIRAPDDLVALAADPEPVVRRAAFEGLRKLDEPRGLAAARETLADPVMRPTAGDDALAVVAEFARPAEAARTIVAELARPDDRDGLWLGAIHLARELEIESAAPHLARIAEGPITSSVLPHVAALSALRELGGPRSRPDLSHLERIDHLEIQRELGEWDWHGSRYG
jgi:HEAT repeat protein